MKAPSFAPGPEPWTPCLPAGSQFDCSQLENGFALIAPGSHRLAGKWVKDLDAMEAPTLVVPRMENNVSAHR
jgi:hypothetical protein